MRIIICFLSGVFLFGLASGSLFAQNGEITIILLRHAEKDLSAGANKADPNLTAEGQRRAERFFELAKDYQPSRIFSTIFKRAKETVTPLAMNLNADYRLQIQFYDHTELEDFAEQLLNLKAKSVVVVGHNTTTPELVNLLIGQNKYQPLADSEYDKIWILKIKRRKGKPYKIEDKVIRY